MVGLDDFVISEWQIRKRVVGFLSSPTDVFPTQRTEARTPRVSLGWVPSVPRRDLWPARFGPG